MASLYYLYMKGRNEMNGCFVCASATRPGFVMCDGCMSGSDLHVAGLVSAEQERINRTRRTAVIGLPDVLAAGGRL